MIFINKNYVYLKLNSNLKKYAYKNCKMNDKYTTKIFFLN